MGANGTKKLSSVENFLFDIFFLMYCFKPSQAILLSNVVLPLCTEACLHLFPSIKKIHLDNNQLDPSICVPT